MAVTRLAQTCIREVKSQHGEEHVEQSADDLGRLAATPNGGKGQNADQIVDAVLKTTDRIVSVLHLHFQVRPLMRAAPCPGCAVHATPARTCPAEQRKGSPAGC